jgi:hypothetical protein
MESNDGVEGNKWANSDYSIRLVLHMVILSS